MPAASLERVLAVIPARGGSKGVPRKNVRLLLGKPLIAWTIEAAEAAHTLDSFIVSTDDSEIADVARQCGAPVLLRPPELAGDRTPMLDVLRHTLQHHQASILVVLQPTSPLRDAALIDHCIEKFIAEDADSLATGYMTGPCYEWGACPPNRQEMAQFFHNDGNVYITRAPLVAHSTAEDTQRGGLRLGTKTATVLTEEPLHYEIDTEFQFQLVEHLLRARLAGDLNPGAGQR